MWVVLMNAEGACWTIPGPEVRMQADWSLQRRPAGKRVPAAPRIMVAPHGTPSTSTIASTP